MLGLLLMAGLGIAATALIDHADHHGAEAADQDSDSDSHNSPSHHDDEDADHSNDDLLDHAALHPASDLAEHDHGQHHASGHGTAHPVTDEAPSQTTVDDTAHLSAASGRDHGTQAAGQSARSHGGKVFGSEEDDTLHGASGNDLIEGNGGNDRVYGLAGHDHLVGFDAGRDTLFGGAGNDTLHGYMVQKQPDGSSFVIEDHQADHLYGGLGKDTLYLGSSDVGTGGRGADDFHVSWDVEQGKPAEITDYNPKQDRICVEYTTNHADADMTEIRPEEQTITTQPMANGAGTAILLNGEAIAHVLGAAHLKASDVQLIRA